LDAFPPGDSLSGEGDIMTEAEWLACSDPEAAVELVWRTASDRKVRLIACGCCRLAWAWLIDERSRNVVEVSERFADGLATSDEVRRAAWKAEAAVFAIDEKQDRYRREQRAIREGWLDVEDAVEDGFRIGPDQSSMPFTLTRTAAECAEFAASAPGGVLQEMPNPIFSPVVVRDVFGNPFRPASLDPAWLTDTVVALARGLYDARDFSVMPILADALQDAGCDSDDILTHCRGPGPHVRGCWVVDLVLGKE
jgi:hypothetical protein